MSSTREHALEFGTTFLAGPTNYSTHFDINPNNI